MALRRLGVLYTHRPYISIKQHWRQISTVEVGTAYESLVVSTFNHLGAQLQRVGGASDNGIDFSGSWKLPDHKRFYLVGQCKHYERKKIGPSIIREWEGVMSRQEIDTLGLVAATSGFTTSGIYAALSSKYPVALVTLANTEKTSRLPDKHNSIRGFVWNIAAEPFIGRMMVTKRHYDIHKVDLEDPAEYTIQLFWDGKPLPAASTISRDPALEP
ncbi:hypothetical protein H4S08_003297 [Coemansia sp. RSA 1365]|nr:hypothetical protein H4S08_003297 [Coemansia sp. RSA 1365]